MSDFELLCTAVSERGDLFVQTMDSCLAMLDQKPARILVHEDVRPGSEPDTIWKWLEKCGVPYEHQITRPAKGLGPAMLWCLRQAKTPIIFYTQEDWEFVRPVPVRRALEVLEAHALNHVRFNKRKTMRAKHEDKPDKVWRKVEVDFPMPDGVTERWCISDHTYTQASLTRVRPLLEAVEAVAKNKPQANEFVAAFNHWLNTRSGAGERCMDQQTRHKLLKTYIWGAIPEPAFIKHLGSVRTTGPIQHVGEIREMGRGK